MAIIQPQLWDGYPLLGDDGYPVVDPACCCPAAPPPEDECTFCIPGTFNSTTAAVVYFTGSVSNDGCDKCNEHMMRQEFELPRMDIPGGENKDPCTYYLGGALGCNVSGSGSDWMDFGWHFWTAGFFNGVLVLHYYCICRARAADVLFAGMESRGIQAVCQPAVCEINKHIIAEGKNPRSQRPHTGLFVVCPVMLC